MAKSQRLCAKVLGDWRDLDCLWARALLPSDLVHVPRRPRLLHPVQAGDLRSSGRTLGVVFSDGSGKSHHPKAIARVGWALTVAISPSRMRSCASTALPSCWGAAMGRRRSRAVN